MSATKHFISSRIEKLQWYHHAIMMTMALVVTFAIVSLFTTEGSHYLTVPFIAGGLIFIASFFVSQKVFEYSDTEFTIHSISYSYSFEASQPARHPISGMQAIARVTPSCFSIEIQSDMNQTARTLVTGNEKDIDAFFAWASSKPGVQIRDPDFQVDPHREISKLVVVLILLISTLIAAIFAALWLLE